MKITETVSASYIRAGAANPKSAAAVQTGSEVQDVSCLTLPSVAELIRVNEPTREQRLAFLSHAVRSGEYATDPMQTAAAIVERLAEF